VKVEKSDWVAGSRSGYPGRFLARVRGDAERRRRVLRRLAARVTVSRRSSRARARAVDKEFPNPRLPVEFPSHDRASPLRAEPHRRSPHRGVAPRSTIYLPRPDIGRRVRAPHEDTDQARNSEESLKDDQEGLRVVRTELGRRIYQSKRMDGVQGAAKQLEGRRSRLMEDGPGEGGRVHSSSSTRAQNSTDLVHGPCRSCIRGESRIFVLLTLLGVRPSCTQCVGRPRYGPSRRV